MEQLAILRIESSGNITVKDVLVFLKSIDLLYKNVSVFEKFREGAVGLLAAQYGGAPQIDDAAFLAETKKVDPLVVLSVEIHSPGFWEFLGGLNPLEQIRKYLNDRHERIKDETYRNAEEHRKLKLENMNMAVEVARNLKTLLREMGVSEEETKRTIEAHIIPALKGLSRAQDKSQIGGATMRSVERVPPREEA